MSIVRISPLDTPDYQERIAHLSALVWPEFMLHDPVAHAHWDKLFAYFPRYQFALMDESSGTIAGKANSLPLAWDDDPEELPDGGWDWAFEQGVADYQAGKPARTQCALQIAIAPQYQGQGLSRRMVAEMKATGRTLQLARLIAPVRPTLKDRYPLTPTERYITWQNERGEPFDPWLRVHYRSGGQIVKACPQAMRISGTVADWEKWAKMRFPESGQYVVPGALTPVSVDYERDTGLYVEPNVWMMYDLQAP